MNAHKVAATFMEDGTLVLKGLPFHAGDTVEIIILEQPQEDQRPWLAQGRHSLAGTVQQNDDDYHRYPFSLAFGCTHSRSEFDGVTGSLHHSLILQPIGKTDDDA
ncbi:MAG: hypothetical protein ACHWZW_09215 [Spirulina sp.]